MKKTLLILGSIILIVGVISLAFTSDETQQVFINGKIENIKKPMSQQEPRKTVLKPFQEEPKKPVTQPNEGNPEPKEVDLSLEPIIDPQNYHWPDDQISAGDVYLDGGRPVHVDIDTFLSLRKGDSLTLVLDNDVFVGTVTEYNIDPTETGSLLSITLEESGKNTDFGEPSLWLLYRKYNPESINKDLGWINSGTLYVRYPSRRYNVRIFENRGLLMTEGEFNQSWSEKRPLPQ
jgi:hypothetical protein